MVSLDSPPVSPLSYNSFDNVFIRGLFLKGSPADDKVRKSVKLIIQPLPIVGIKFSRLDDFCQSADADSGSGLRSVIASLLSELCHVWCSHGIEKTDQLFQSLLMSSGDPLRLSVIVAPFVVLLPLVLLALLT